MLRSTLLGDGAVGNSKPSSKTDSERHKCTRDHHNDRESFLVTILMPRRFYTYLSTNIGPRALKKLGYRALEPRGRQRTASEDFSIAVPFNYMPEPTIRRPKIAVVCHLFHPELSTWFLNVLEQSGLEADIYVSTDTSEKKKKISAILANWSKGSATVRLVENRGRDVAPKILTFPDIYNRYDLLLFLHSKKSVHYDFGEAWRNYLVQCLAGSPSISESILEIFRHRRDVGIVFPQHFHRLTAVTPIDWGSNFQKARRLARRMDINLSPNGIFDMISGSMFWARPAALKPLLDLALSIDHFPGEYGQLDGTLAHAIERLFLFICERTGFTWVKVTREALVTPNYPIAKIHSQCDIDSFMTEHRFDLLGA